MEIKIDLDPNRIYILNYLKFDSGEPDSVRFTSAYYVKIIDGHLLIHDKTLIMSFAPGRWKSIICKDKIYYPDEKE